jgi:hypothetical protein
MSRRNWVLGEMAELGWITPQQAKVALATDLNVQEAPARARYRDADYFVEEVRLRAKALKSVGDQVGRGRLLHPHHARPRDADRGPHRADERHRGLRPPPRAGAAPRSTSRSTDSGRRKPAPCAGPPSGRAGSARVSSTWTAPRRGAAVRRRRRHAGGRGREMGSGRQGPAVGRPGLRRAAGGRALRPAPGAPGERRPRGRGPVERARARHGRRLQLLAVELQPGDPGGAPAGLGLQALRLRHGAGETGSPRPAASWTRPSPSAAPTARPGRPPTISAAPSAGRACAMAWSIRATR